MSLPASSVLRYCLVKWQAEVVSSQGEDRTKGRAPIHGEELTLEEQHPSGLGSRLPADGGALKF